MSAGSLIGRSSLILMARWVRLEKKHPDSPRKTIPKPTISVILPTHQRLSLLGRALNALRAQDFSPDQVIVVDDASTDGTAAYLQRLARDWPALRVCTRTRQGGPAAARNDGIRQSHGQWIAFTDDDCCPDSGWLGHLVERTQVVEDIVGGIAGAIWPYVPDTWLGTYIQLSLRHQGNLDSEGKVVFLDTANALYRREALEQTSGFDTAFALPGGEDIDLSFRVQAAGWTLQYAPRAVVWHIERPSLNRLLRQSFHFGQGMGMLRCKYPQRFSGLPSSGWTGQIRRALAYWAAWARGLQHPGRRRRLLSWAIQSEMFLRILRSRLFDAWSDARGRYRSCPWPRQITYRFLDEVDRWAHFLGEIWGVRQYVGKMLECERVELSDGT